MATDEWLNEIEDLSGWWVYSRHKSKIAAQKEVKRCKDRGCDFPHRIRKVAKGKKTWQLSSSE